MLVFEAYAAQHAQESACHNEHSNTGGFVQCTSVCTHWLKACQCMNSSMPKSQPQPFLFCKRLQKRLLQALGRDPWLGTLGSLRGRVKHHVAPAGLHRLDSSMASPRSLICPCVCAGTWRRSLGWAQWGLYRGG